MGIMFEKILYRYICNSYLCSMFGCFQSNEMKFLKLMWSFVVFYGLRWQTERSSYTASDERPDIHKSENECVFVV